MSLNAVARKLVFTNRRRKNELVEGGSWLIDFEAPTELQCFARR
jgi:hypothetical protein